MKKFILSLVISLLFLGCKSVQNVRTSEAFDAKMSVKQRGILELLIIRWQIGYKLGIFFLQTILF